MRRVVSLWLPTWPTDRRRRRPGAPAAERPLVVADRAGSRRLVVAADRAAQAAGLHPGMTVAHAQAMVPALLVTEADADGDAAALERLARWCLRYAPLAAPDPPDGIVIDITGCAPLFGGEAALLADLDARLDGAGLAVRAAIADTWAAAWALARFAAPAMIAPPGATAEVLASLPAAALRLPPAVAVSLGRLGFERIADLAVIPRAALALRFGAAVLERLDRAEGRLAEPIRPVSEAQAPAARLTFAEPIGVDSLAAIVRRLARMLCRDLASAARGARRLDLLAFRVDREVAALRAGLAQACRDPDHIARLFTERLGSIDPGFGIEAAELVAQRTEPLDARQLASGLGAVPEPDLAPLIDRLAGRIGARRLFRLAPVESDLPERALRRIPALSPPVAAGWPDAPRPARLLDPPEPVAVTALLPDDPPALFVWNGRRRRVCRADGPERVFGEWWRTPAEAAEIREYFRVEDADGQRFWLFRRFDADGTRWFVHGLFA
ncbi:MAG: DNA polymerase Y family protein [Rhodospirillales bacterium]|nr:DNA polymerase Y family protein [Rhodospirillales bacterium]